MLSRLAESLFWIGRYVERAEDTARLLDVHVHMLLEHVPADEELVCRGLLAAMGVPTPPGPVEVRTVTELLAFDPDGGGSILASMRAARENARGARDVVSSEMFSCLNRAHNSLPAQVEAARRQGPGEFFAFIRRVGAEFHGLADSTMSRDEGWLFLVLGRSIERVDMATRFLATRVVDLGASASWVALLRSFSAYESYLRAYRNAVEPAQVLEFLLLDRIFPRSVFAALREAERCADELSPLVGRAGVSDNLRRTVGRARSELEFLDPEDLLPALPDLLKHLQGAVAQAGLACSERYFRAASAPVTWRQDFSA